MSDQATITVRLNVSAVDPTRTDPHEIVEYLLDLLDVEVRAGNGPDWSLEDDWEAEWA